MNKQVLKVKLLMMMERYFMERNISLQLVENDHKWNRSFFCY